MFCSPRRLAPFAILLAGSILTTCSRKTPQPEERIAILRFENVGDAGYDWIGRGLSELLTAQLAGRPNRYAISSVSLHALGRAAGPRPIQAPGVSAEDSLALLQGATAIGYGDYTVRGGRLDARLYLQDAVTHRYIQVVSASGSADDVVSVANALAAQIASDPEPAGVHSTAAVRDYVKGLEGTVPQQIISDAQAAIAADPGFIPPYRVAAEWEARQGNAAQALALLEEASRQRGSPVEQARLHLQIAGLKKDAAGQLLALAELANADPGNPQEWRTLADTEFARHRYAEAVAAFQKVTALEPRNQQAFNLLGYSLAYSGKVPAAVEALQHYQALAPNEADPIDSTGDVYLLSGHPHEAETFYLSAYQKNPKSLEGIDLFKASVARLMAGDIPGATEIHERYVQAIAQLPNRNADIERIEWMWLSGQRGDSCRRMIEFARAAENSPRRETAERAYGEAAIWTLLLGDRAAAAQMADKALHIPGGQVSASALLAQFLAQPAASAEELTASSKKLFGNPALETVDRLALACRFLIDRQYSGAAQILQTIYDDGARTPGDEGIPLMLAWALIGAGHEKEAAPLLAANPVPPATGFTIFTSFYFPRLYALRKAVAEKAGDMRQAQENDRLYRLLSGPQPLIWDK